MARRTLALTLATALLATPAAGQIDPTEPSGPENECCLVLLIPVGARAVALGGALTSRSSADAVFRNPAGLAGLEQDAFFVHHSEPEFASTA
ncbi:MAG: hypothetical protein GWN71_13080, partial [Gammaproteobacteria bacterium]|nr:hypothetical protein [Gammaproteobacteria bacterium]